MSSGPSNPSSLDQLDEQLTAYLDGELEPQAVRQLENMLAGDERARQRLSQLAASWDLLDQLPRASVDDLFTRTTVEMVALAAEDEIAKAEAAHPERRRRRWLEGVVATAAAAIVGFAIVGLAIPDQNDALLKDLPIVKNLPLYRDVGSIELLKLFQLSELFAEPSTPAATGKSPEHDDRSSITTAANSAMVPTFLGERRAWVESLSPAEKLELRDQFEKFTSMPAKQRASLRELEQQLSTDKDNAQLRLLMQRYYVWLKTLTSPDRANLLDEPTPQDQIKLIKALEQRQMQQAFTWLEPGQYLLKDPDSGAVLRWMRKFTLNHRAELNDVAERQGNAPKGDDPRRRRAPPVVLAWETWWSQSASASPPLTKADIHSLRALLSPEKQRQLDTEETSLQDQVQLVRGWIQSAWDEFGQLAARGFGRWSMGGPSPDRLKRFEDQLPPEEKKELQDLKGDEHERKLIKLYLKHNPPDMPRAGGGFMRSRDDFPPPGQGRQDNRDKGGPPRPSGGKD